ncbi:MAG TPA: D-alanine--D-alanine ligase family protein [Chloroflexia bacterium]|nr:D-alanine--D-alanine ligase family protein [Chloroflexia bacterium]
MEQKIRVGVLFGGQSSEHEVSLASARSVMGAMDPAKYEVVPIGITKRGAWLASDDPMAALRSGVDAANLPRLSSVLAPDPTGESQVEIVYLAPATNGSRMMSAEASQPLDVIFPVLHGPYGEDGTVQGLLELTGIPYVGSGVLGSALGMDKHTMKRLFIAQGLPVAPYLAVTSAQWSRDPAGVRLAAEERLTYPMFAKPGNMGSSIGISKIHGPHEFAIALDVAARYDRRLLIEQGLDARECECAVLGNDDPEASVVGEVVPGNEFYDYRAKYVDDNSDLVIPAHLPEKLAQEIRRLSIEAFKTIDAAGMARVDFFVARDLSKVWLNEINTIPGFTRISMYPKLWEASGLSYSQLIDRLIELAIERHAERVLIKSALDDVGADLSV